MRKDDQKSAAMEERRSDRPAGPLESRVEVMDAVSVPRGSQRITIKAPRD